MSAAAAAGLGETAHSYQVRSVDRALDLLAEFEDANAELSLLELTARSGLAKPTVYRLLTTLRQRCYLRQCPESRSYRLGPAYLDRLEEVPMLGCRGSAGLAANDRCARRLRRFADDSRATVGLSVRVGGRRVLVAQATPSDTDVSGAYPMVGDSTELVADPAGHLLLAAMGSAGATAYLRANEQRSRLRLAWDGPEPITARLDRILEQGWSHGPLCCEPVAHMVAAPVIDHRQRVAAVVHVHEAGSNVGLGDALRAAVVREAQSMSFEMPFRFPYEDEANEA